MRFCITTLLLAAISMDLRFTLAFSFGFYSRGRRTLNTLLPHNVTSESTTQTTVIPTTNLTSANATFAPWPVRPFDIKLPSEGYTLGIRYASAWDSRPPIDLMNLVDFISAFGDNLEENYPPPAFAPERAGSRYIDGKTLTRWIIEVERTVLGRAIPTEVVLECLDELNILLRRYGPAWISSVIYTGTSRFFGSATLSMFIAYLAGNALNVSSPSGHYDFEAS